MRPSFLGASCGTVRPRVPEARRLRIAGYLTFASAVDASDLAAVDNPRLRRRVGDVDLSSDLQCQVRTMAAGQSVLRYSGSGRLTWGLILAWPAFATKILLAFRPTGRYAGGSRLGSYLGSWSKRQACQEFGALILSLSSRVWSCSQTWRQRSAASSRCPNTQSNSCRAPCMIGCGRRTSTTSKKTRAAPHTTPGGSVLSRRTLTGHQEGRPRPTVPTVRRLDKLSFLRKVPVGPEWRAGDGRPWQAPCDC